MTQPIRLTKTQRRHFYREAVMETLIAVYGLSETVAGELVSAWWKRLAKTDALKSDLLFHAEPLHTAADLAGIESIAMTSEKEKTYHRVLRLARDRAVNRSRGGKVRTPPVESEFRSKITVHASGHQRKTRKPLEQRLLARG